MITVVMKYTESKQIKGFISQGHAGYADSGSDIVCSAVTALVFNCVESIQLYTDAKVSCKVDDKAGSVDFTVNSEVDDKVNLLLLSLLHGLERIQESYSSKFIDIIS